VLLRPLQFAIYGISRLSVRDDNWWVFGSWSGKRFGDNSGALFVTAAVAEPPAPRVTWISARRDIVRDLRARGHDARLQWSPSGLWACLRAGVYVFDGYTKDVNHWLSNGAARVLLRHGVGMKRIDRGIDIPSHRLYKLFRGSWSQRIFWRIVLPWHAVRPDLVLATSPEHATQAVEYFGVPRDRVVITGFPRHDVLFARPTEVDSPPPAVQSIRAELAPTFLFMPTFRDGFARHDFDYAGLDRAATTAGVVVYVKLHFVDAERGTDDHGDRTRWPSLRFVDPTIDPTVLYPEVDGLITDFSSASFDFMLLEKPIIYFVPDYDHFLCLRSLYYPFDDVTPGPKCRTLEALAAAMTTAVQVGLGEHEKHYQRLLDRFYTHRDGGSSDRAYAAIRERLVGG
jgi:hypothetical protein